MTETTCTACSTPIRDGEIADAEGKCRHCSDRNVIMPPGPYQGQETPVSSPYTVEEVEYHLNNVMTGKKSWLNNIWILLLSIFLFFGTGLSDNSFSGVLIIIAALFIHELGHFVGMKLFKYRDVHMFFIPMFGAATSGVDTKASGARRIIVSILGPMPGIFLGILCWFLYFFAPNPTLLAAARTFIILNLFNLLPLLPLDGGHIINDLIFSRHPKLEVAFSITASIGLLALSIRFGFTFLAIIAVILLLGVRLQYRHATLAQRLKKRLPADSLVVSGPVPKEYIQELMYGVTPYLPKSITLPNLASHIFMVWQKVCYIPPSAAATAGLFILYAFALFLGVGAEKVFETIRSHYMANVQ